MAEKVKVAMNTIALRPWELAAYMREKKLLVVRPVKPQPPSWAPDKIGVHDLDEPPGYGFFDEDGAAYRCPFGKPGEVLGIKEAWNYFGGDEYLYQREISCVAYKATHSSTYWTPDRWRPSIHMPPWAVRFKPTIADIRVMRVQDVSHEDAMTIGVEDWAGERELPLREQRLSLHQIAWSHLCDKVFGAGSWDANIWVWATNVVE